MTTFTSEDRISATKSFRWNAYQEQECIQFFWPLTEQIPLSLDYTGCDAPQYVYAPTTSGTLFTGTTGTICYNHTPTWTTSINVDTNDITITSKNKPPLYRRVLYKLLGINWKQS